MIELKKKLAQLVARANTNKNTTLDVHFYPIFIWGNFILKVLIELHWERKSLADYEKVLFQAKHWYNQQSQIRGQSRDFNTIGQQSSNFLSWMLSRWNNKLTINENVCRSSIHFRYCIFESESNFEFQKHYNMTVFWLKGKPNFLSS